MANTTVYRITSVVKVRIRPFAAKEIPHWDDMVGLISIAVQPNQKSYELGRWSVKVSLTQIGTTFGLDVPPERPEPVRVQQTLDYCTICVSLSANGVLHLCSAWDERNSFGLCTCMYIFIS